MIPTFAGASQLEVLGRGFLVLLLFIDGKIAPSGFPPPEIGSFGLVGDVTFVAAPTGLYDSANPSTLLTLALLLEIES